jgi:hypothetical protein
MHLLVSQDKKLYELLCYVVHLIEDKQDSTEGNNFFRSIGEFDGTYEIKDFVNIGADCFAGWSRGYAHRTLQGFGDLQSQLSGLIEKCSEEGIHDEDINEICNIVSVLALYGKQNEIEVHLQETHLNLMLHAANNFIGRHDKETILEILPAVAREALNVVAPETMDDVAPEALDVVAPETTDAEDKVYSRGVRLLALATLLKDAGLQKFARAVAGQVDETRGDPKWENLKKNFVSGIQNLLHMLIFKKFSDGNEYVSEVLYRDNESVVKGLLVIAYNIDRAAYTAKWPSNNVINSVIEFRQQNGYT